MNGNHKLRTLAAAADLDHLLPQPAVGVVTAILALCSLSASLWASLAALPAMLTLSNALLLAGLLAAVVLSYAFPIHIRRSTQLCIYTVPLYLIAVLLPPLLAAATAGAGILVAELVTRKKRRTYGSDIATAAGRLTLVVQVGSAVAHLPLVDLWPLILAALALWLCESLTTPLLIAPMCNERPLEVLTSYLRQSSTVEWAQYVLGIAGALAARQSLWALLLLALPLVAVHQHFKRLKELHDRTRHLLERIADTVDDHDAYTGGHSRRVTAYTTHLVRALVVDRVEADLIVMAARIHDIGKIDIPSSILQKPGRLTEAERALVEMHPDLGADMLQQYADFRRGADMVRFHHEAWNGAGYPRGLRGTAIPFGARVIAVADSYDAMTSDRPYRRGMSPDQAAMELRQGRGTQWDPEIVDAFLHILPDLVARPPSTPLRLVPSARAGESLAIAR